MTMACMISKWSRFRQQSSTTTIGQSVLLTYRRSVPYHFCCTQLCWVVTTRDNSPVYYFALVHFKHWLSVLRAFTLTEPAEFRALKVPGWRTANGQKMQCEIMDTTHSKRAPSWLRSGRGGALSEAFQFGKLADWRFTNHFNHYCWLQ